MPGLDVSVEEKKATVAALVREHAGYLQRAASVEDEDEKKIYQSRAEEVAEQLRVRGHDGEAPAKRAATRAGHPKAETR